MAALRNGAPAVTAARAKKAVACLLWMNGVPSEQLERMVMQHYFDRNAIGPIRAVASRTQDIIGAVLDMAAVIHPAADLARLANLLPVQLELGIPADFVPIALAGAGLSPRELPQSDRRGTEQAGADHRGRRRDRAEVHREQPPTPAGAPGCRPASRRGRRRSGT